jgi:hypothetical protein
LSRKESPVCAVRRAPELAWTRQLSEN